MSQPVFLDQALTNVSNAWFNQDSDFIADKVFPVVTVTKKTFDVAKYSKDNLRVPSSSVRTGEAKAKRVTYGRSFDVFGPLQEHSLSDFVTQDDYDQSQDPFDPESDAVENINSIMALIDEKDVATMLSDTAVITQNVNLATTPTNQWSDYGNSNPFDDIKTGAKLMRSSNLMVPNTFFCSWDTWVMMVDHPDFLDRIKWSQTGVMGESDFLKLFTPYGITQIFVGKAVENTANQGATDALGSIWGKNAWLGYVTNTPGRKQVNGGYKFQLENARTVSKEAKLNPSGTEIVNKDYYNHALMNASCFYLFKNAVA